MVQLYTWLNWVVPYHKYLLNVALSYDSVVELFASFSSVGMAINSSSRLNQGRYRVQVDENRVQVRGPYGKSRFPLETQLIIQPIQSKNGTSIWMESRPTVKALLFPIGMEVMYLIFLSGIVFQSGQTVPIESLLLLLYPYAIVVLFFNIEMRTLVNVLNDNLQP